MTNNEMIKTLLSQLSDKKLKVIQRLEKLNLLRDLAWKENDEELLIQSCKALIDIANKNIMKLPKDTQMVVHEMLKDAHTQLGRYDFESFMIAMEWYRPIEKRFYQPRMKVLKPVVKDLQDLADGKIDIYCLSMPPRVGKLLSDNTPVLTSKGWKKHGELCVGDEVYGMDGKKVKVTHVFPKDYADIEVTFSNGEKIKCHENHEWVVYDRRAGKIRTLETKEMMKRNLWSGNPSGRGHRYVFQLPNRLPFLGERKELHVDPYTLGAWLGDGETNNPVICYHPKDKIVFETIIENGYVISASHTHKGTGVCYVSFDGLRQQLRKYGMCHSIKRVEKFIPEDYLTASIYDRLELLAGLLDTDGYLNKKEHRYQFTTCDEKLRDSFIQLVSTFGWRCSVTRHEPSLSSSGIQGKRPYYVISFNPTIHIPCRIERKQLHEFSKQRRVAITSIKKCPREQGNCISVEGGVYCVGEQMILTHNSTIGLFFDTYMAGRYPDEHIFAAGYASGLVGTFYNGVLDFINSPEYRFYEIFPELADKFNKSAENRTIDLWDDGRYKTITFRSIDGQITGALEASSLMYLDDMCSGIEEAMNIDRLDKLWQKVSVDLMQRRVMNKRTGRLAPILAIGTIWSLHDPISRLKREHLEDARFRERIMPALDDNDHSNFNYDYGVGFTDEMYINLRKGMDEVSWECVYQQHPMERDGLLFPKGDLKYYMELPNKEPDNIVAFCDVAFGSDDFLSFPIAYIYGEDAYIVDVVFRKKMSYQITEPMVVGKIVEHGVQSAEFEANNGGDFYARDVDRMLRDTTQHRCHITWRNAPTKMSKLARIVQFQSDIKSYYYKDPSMYDNKDDYGMFMQNLTTFVSTGSSKNDDGPDSMAGLSRLIKIPRIGRIDTKRGVREWF